MKDIEKELKDIEKEIENFTLAIEDVEESFRDMINSDYESIEILGINFHALSILESDEHAYSELLHNFLNDEQNNNLESYQEYNELLEKKEEWIYETMREL